jgi:hypothetical protein
MLEAIKAYRTATGVSLEAAKFAIEEMRAGWEFECRRFLIFRAGF